MRSIERRGKGKIFCEKDSEVERRERRSDSENEREIEILRERQ